MSHGHVLSCDFNKRQNSYTFAGAAEVSLSESALHPNEAELIKTSPSTLHQARAENTPSFHMTYDLRGL